MATLASDPQAETLYQAWQVAITNAVASHAALIAAADNVQSARDDYQSKAQLAHDAMAAFIRRVAANTSGAAFRDGNILVFVNEFNAVDYLKRRFGGG